MVKKCIWSQIVGANEKWGMEWGMEWDEIC